MGNEASSVFEAAKQGREQERKTKQVLSSVKVSRSLSSDQNASLTNDLAKKNLVVKELQRVRRESVSETPELAPDINLSAKSIVAKRGRQIFSDFQNAQTNYARQWGESKGVEGVATLFETESPELAKRYGIISPESCGVTAVVCKGFCRDTRLVVAIKFVRIRVQGLNDRVRRRDCMEEARLQSLCQHDNVVRLLDFHLGPNFAIYVMEYVTESLLQNIVELNSQFTYSETNAAGFIKDIAHALDACHTHNVVHMDVKLDNILCTNGNVAKLCDFGIAECMVGDRPIRRNVAAPLFAPPEIYTTGLCDTKADMWSLGVVLYILLCGYAPFKDTELKSRIMSARYTFPERDWSDVSIMARDLISRLLIIDTTRRFSARQVLDHPWVQALSELPDAGRDGSPEYHSLAEDLQPDSKVPPAVEPEVVHDPNHQVSELSSSEMEDDFEVLEVSNQKNVPLPLRVTQFLRGMHHYRELEKRGFENVPGAQLYRAVLNGVDEITVSLGDVESSPSWISRKINHTLHVSAKNDKLRHSTDASGEIIVSPLTAQAAKRQTELWSGLLEKFEPYYYPDEDDEYSSSVTISANKPPESISNEVKETFSLLDIDQPPNSISDDVLEASPIVTKPPRMTRVKSYDVHPVVPGDWIDDCEAISCRICDNEFTVLNRRHHCRACGQIICESCSLKRKLDIVRGTSLVRVCKLCGKHKIAARRKSSKVPFQNKSVFK